MDDHKDLPGKIKWDIHKDLIKSAYDYEITSFQEELGRLEFYLNEIEGFIETQEKEELKSISPKKPSLEWYIPIHWDEIFRYRLRSSFIAIMISYMETFLNNASKLIAAAVNAPIMPAELKGPTLKRFRRFLNTFGKFARPKDDQWKNLIDIYAIRCLFVHNNGIIPSADEESRFKSIAGRFQGLTIRQGRLLIEKGFCEFSVEFCRGFCGEIQKELETTLTINDLM